MEREAHEAKALCVQEKQPPSVGAAKVVQSGSTNRGGGRSAVEEREVAGTCQGVLQAAQAAK